MGNEAVRALEEAEKLRDCTVHSAASPSGPVKIRLEQVSRRLLHHFKETAERRFFNAFFHLTNPLFQAYACRHLRKFGCAAEAEEVANRMYIILFEKLLAPGERIPMDYLFPWCYKVMANLVREEYRTSIRQRPLELNPAERSSSPSPLDQLIEKEESEMDRIRLERVLDCLYSEASGLSRRDRGILRLFYLEGRSMRQISAETDLSKSHVGVILMRGRRRIARRLGLGDTWS